MIRVFIADDHAIMRDGLRRLLSEMPDMVCVGEASKGRDVLDKASTEAWDVLVLDLSLEDIGGVEVLRRLRQAVPALPVVVLSMYPESQYAVRILKMGAAAYLSKGRSSTELVRAIRTVAAGKHYVTDAAAQALVAIGASGANMPHQRLSAREFQVFMLVTKGFAPGEIAAELNLTPSTVSSHLIHIRTKLGVRTNGEVMQYAYRAGLAGESG
jgi:two-component system invasion response regulator UvrY